MSEIEYIEDQIKSLLYEMSNVFSDIHFREEITSSYAPDFDYKSEIFKLEDNFKELSFKVYKMCMVYFEVKSLKEYLFLFKSETQPIISNPHKLLSGTYHEDMGEHTSNIVNHFWQFLSVFPAFGKDQTEFLLKRTGVFFLEHILNSTSVILRSLNIIPKSETEIYKNVKIVTQATFPSAQFPSESFQKTAKCYIPDILLPSLNCAVEYKYAESESKLINTIDQILIDVSGYKDNSIYKLFYAVFYAKPGIWTKDRFDEVWREKEFPENWKGIFVIGE